MRVLKRVAIFASFAIICVVFGNEENCAKEKVNECKLKLLEILFGDFTDQEACQEMRGVSDCLRNVVNECLGGEGNPEVDDALKEFEESLDNNCQGDGVMKCLDDNEEYLVECVTERDDDDISQLLQHESVPADMDPKFVRCHLYGLMSHCVVGRAVEKCGAAGGERAAELLSDLPVSVKRSCESQEDSLQESKKKRAAPYASILKRALPYASRMKRALPYASRMKRALPYASRMKRALSYASRMNRALPYASK
ncbi:hypothetical protein JTE90_000144 [Oedothorax gibbosus]|uniref:Uncharacterized protein n=1 Tax=Oedothorax gibbosus TaxID=931172 RepID=A0AAV6U592_9ARAC|nr:hypothetical protein JTE90_000144 [Oedothorax gibbosus]